MSDARRRVLMAVVGIHVLVFYLGAAALAYWLLSWLWTGPSSLAETGLVLLLLTVLFGYLTYRYGTGRLLASLDATPLTRESSPTLYGRVDRLCDAMGIDPPVVAVADLEAPNAMALGGAGRGVLVFDWRLFRLLSAGEFEAILAHELAHLESHDSLVQTLAYSLVRTLVGVTTILLLPAILALTGLARGYAWIRGRPGSVGVLDWVRVGAGQAVTLVLLTLTLLVRAHSRRREFAADDRAAEVTGRPVVLARALRKIQRASEPGRGLFRTLYVEREEDPLTRLLSTHPDVDERIERLLERADREGERSRRRSIEIR